MRRGELCGRACAVLASAGLSCVPAAAPETPRADVGDLERRIETQLARAEELTRRLPAGAELLPPRASEAPGRLYTPVPIRFEPLPSGAQAVAERMAVETLAAAGARTLVVRSPRGERVYAPGGPFPGVPAPVLYGISGAAQASLAGSELDVIVPLEEGGRWHVTVWNEPDRRVVASGLPAEVPAAPAAEPPEYALATGSNWSTDEHLSLRRALTLLTEEERTVLGELRFERRGRASRLPGGPHACGDFVFRDQQRAVRIYDCAFDGDARHFVGPLDRPERPSTLAILHELGHALALARAAEITREAFEERERVERTAAELRRLARRARRVEMRRVAQLQARLEVLSDRFDELGQRLRREAELPGPVAAFVRVPGAAGGITPYGRSAPMEAFAEAFALHRLDRPALERVAPEVAQFFDRRGHLEPKTPRP